MAESTHWSFPSELQPRASDVTFDLKPTLDAVVMLRSVVPDRQRYRGAPDSHQFELDQQ